MCEVKRQGEKRERGEEEREEREERRRERRGRRGERVCEGEREIECVRERER